jgi:hypothetical protein
MDGRRQRTEDNMDAIAHKHNAAVALFSAMGYDVIHVSVDVPGESAIIELKRTDGKYVTAVADRNGWRVDLESAKVSHPNGRGSYARLGTVLISRNRGPAEGIRHALRCIGNHIGDNAPSAAGKALGREAIRLLV